MPYFARACLGPSDAEPVSYTIERDGTLLLALCDLTCAFGCPGSEEELLKIIRCAVDAHLERQMLSAMDAVAPWIRKDREVGLRTAPHGANSGCHD